MAVRTSNILAARGMGNCVMLGIIFTDVKQLFPMLSERYAC